MILGGDGTGSVVSEPAGIACPPTCTAPFPYGTEVTLVARPEPAKPFLSWKFGCTPTSADPRRCVLTATNRPNWVGVALGEDDQIGQPTNLAVLFDVTREGEGTVAGRELDCGTDCEHRYAFGSREELRATAADGWRFTAWNGACAKEATCILYVGPVTSVAARFTENLAPQLESVRATGKKAGRNLRSGSPSATRRRRGSSFAARARRSSSPSAVTSWPGERLRSCSRCPRRRNPVGCG